MNQPTRPSLGRELARNFALFGVVVVVVLGVLIAAYATDTGPLGLLFVLAVLALGAGLAVRAWRRR